MPITQEEVNKLHTMQSRILAGEQIPAEELHEAIRISRQWRLSNSIARGESKKSPKRESAKKEPSITMDQFRALLSKKREERAEESPGGSEGDKLL